MAQPTIQQWIKTFQLIKDASDTLLELTKSMLDSNSDILNEDSEMAFGELSDDSDDMAAAQHIIQMMSHFMTEDGWDPDSKDFKIQRDADGHSLSDYIEILDKTKNNELYDPFSDNEDSEIEDFSFSLTMISLT